MAETRFDVLTIGNAIVDVIAPIEDGFLAREGLTEGIMHLEPEYKGPDPMYPAILQIGIVLPSGEKNFYADRQAAPPNFNRMIGAIIVLAGTASPLVFNQKYFYRF